MWINRIALAGLLPIFCLAISSGKTEELQPTQKTEQLPLKQSNELLLSFGPNAADICLALADKLHPDITTQGSTQDQYIEIQTLVSSDVFELAFPLKSDPP